jgi:DnaK suppressor protein
MTTDKLKEYKKKLQQERGMVNEEIKRAEKPVDLGVDMPRFEEESDMAEEVGNQLALAGNLKERLDDIDEALRKMENGTYGICENCHKPIEEEILDIDPESRLCKACKAKGQ